MVVVEQPFRCGCDRPALVGGLGDAAVGFQKHALVVCQAIHEGLAGRRCGGDRLVGGDAFCVLLPAVDAEQLTANSVFVVPPFTALPAPPTPPPKRPPTIPPLPPSP